MVLSCFLLHPQHERSFTRRTLAFIELDDIHKTYARGRVAVPVLKGATLAIERGEMLALMGASGSGKTTLINLLGALDRPTSGRYWLDGDEVSLLSVEERAGLRSRKIGFVFQNFNLLPRLTALENVLMPWPTSAEGRPARERAQRAEALTSPEASGLGDRLDHEPAKLSGGEQQRVAIARSLMNRCALLIADEPTGNLDSHTGEEILGLFRQLNVEDGLTILLVTHDPTVASHADRVIRMRDGLIIEDERAEPPAGLGPRPRTDAAGGLGRRTAFGLKTIRGVADAATMAARSLSRNALRSALLTTLGIIIGVASLIAIAEVGKGSWAEIRRILTKMGVDNVLVQAGAASRNGVSLGSGSVKTLTPEDAEAILRECPSVACLAPIVNGRGQVVRGNRNWVPSSFIGTTPGFLRVRDWEEMADGEAFTDDGGAATPPWSASSGQTLVRELFPDESPIGQEVYVNDVPLKVIGVLRRKGADIIGEDQDDILLAPWSTIKYRISCARRVPPAGRGAGRSPEPSDQINLRAPPLPAMPRPPLFPRPSVPCRRPTRPAWSGTPTSTRDPREDDLHGGDRPRPCRRSAASSASGTGSGPGSATTSPSRTSPRSSRPFRRPSASSRACWCAWRSSPSSWAAWGS